MKRFFCVAKHRFSIEIAGESSRWSTLSNYEPFSSDVSDGLIFELEVHGGRAEAPGKVPLLVERGEEGEPRLDLYRDGSDYWVEVAPVNTMPAVAALRMNEDFSRGVLFCFEERFVRFAIDNSAMLMFAFSTASRGTLEIHASVVVNSSKAYLFLAKSGTGKSTQSRMWLESIPGTTLLNDDNPIVGFDGDGTPRVYGSPWSGKTACYKNESSPIGAFVKIERAPANSISRNSIIDAYVLLSSSASGFKAVESMADGLHDTLSRMALNVPSYTLRCLPDHDAAKVCHDGVQ